jgi:hypothetical protein
MTQHLSTQQLAKLSAQVNEQLAELAANSALLQRKGSEGEIEDLSRQRQAIEKVTEEEADSFLQKFVDKSKEVICNANSDLQKQYEEFGGLKKDEVLEKFAALLAVSGFSGAALEILTLAITVYVLHIGLKKFGEKYCK